ncbi:DUF2911 domain-containing protein [Niabella terrae]
MKKILLLVLSFTVLFFVNAQEKAPKSPAASATGKSETGAVLTITYGQPSVKGRTIGEDLEPLPGQIWRTGANKATVLETSKDVTIDGKALPAGKYSLFTLVDGDEWTIILNKTWDQWGAFKYKSSDDVLRTKVKAEKAASFSEKLTFEIGAGGLVTLLWGDNKVSFTIK